MAENKKKKGGDKKATMAKLENLPFDKIKDWETARSALHLAQWKKLESARLTDQMIRERPEFEYWRNEFSAGMRAYNGDSKELIAKIAKEDQGFSVEISNEFVKAITDNNQIAKFSEGIIKALFQSFAESYYNYWSC